MKRNIFLGTVTLIVGLISVQPFTIHAGDKEWATAGKILTGVVAANVLGDIVWSERHANVKSYAHHQPYRRKGHSKRRFHKYHRPAYPVGWKKHRGYPRYPRIKKKYNPPRQCSGPVIMQLEDGRRIYQPCVRGAQAYLQAYSEVCHQWVTLEEYPSIW